MRWPSPATAALLTVPVVGAAFVLALMRVDALVSQISKHEQSLYFQIDTAMDEVNRTCGPMRACGTLATIDKTLTRVGDLTVTGQKAIHDADAVSLTEAKMLPALNKRILVSFDLIDSAISTTSDDTHRTQLQAQSAIAELQTVLASTDATVNTTTDTVRDLDHFLTSPDLNNALHNVGAITYQSASMLDTARQVEEKATHNYLHPSKSASVRTWHAIQPFLLPMATVGAVVLK